MDQDTLRIVVAGLVVVFIFWIGGFAAYASMRHKVSALAVGPRQSTPVQKVLVLTAIILDGYMILRAFYPSLDAVVFAYPSPAPLLAVVLLCIGAGLMVATHFNMGSSWRIGVPGEGNDIDKLVTGGLHKISRNPIYLGIMIMIAGLVVAAPGPLTIAGFAVTFLGLRKIIAQEESYLNAQFGDAYRDYCARVRRWI